MLAQLGAQRNLTICSCSSHLHMLIYNLRPAELHTPKHAIFILSSNIRSKHPFFMIFWTSDLTCHFGHAILDLQKQLFSSSARTFATFATYIRYIRSARTYYTVIRYVHTTYAAIVAHTASHNTQNIRSAHRYTHFWTVRFATSIFEGPKIIRKS